MSKCGVPIHHTNGSLTRPDTGSPLHVSILQAHYYSLALVCPQCPVGWHHGLAYNSMVLLNDLLGSGAHEQIQLNNAANGSVMGCQGLALADNTQRGSTVSTGSLGGELRRAAGDNSNASCDWWLTQVPKAMRH